MVKAHLKTIDKRFERKYGRFGVVERIHDARPRRVADEDGGGKVKTQTTMGYRLTWAGYEWVQVHARDGKVATA